MKKGIETDQKEVEGQKPQEESGQAPQEQWRQTFLVPLEISLFSPR